MSLATDSIRLPPDPDVTAPDGAEVRVLVASDRGSMAHFQLAAGETSHAVQHLEVEELWFVVEGGGEMWLGRATPVTIALEPGVSLRIPPATPFQFRSTGPEPLAAVAVTMPPWRLDRVEAVAAEGPWTPTVVAGRSRPT